MPEAPPVTIATAPSKVRSEFVGFMGTSLRDGNHQKVRRSLVSLIARVTRILPRIREASMGLAFALMPKGATFHNQTLWGSIGWATPAAFGAAVAARDRRVVLVTGEGSHQLTAQEISQFGRRGLRGYPAINTGKNHPDVVSAPSDEASGGICGGLAAIFRRILADSQ
jgi:hypothetical protein